MIWNSFFATQDNPETLYKTGIRCGGMDCSVHGLATLKYLNLHQKNNYSVCGIIRGHDHKETISQLCYTNINLETCLFPEYTDNSWKTILDTTPLIFDPNTQAFPVFTITSVTDIFGVDNFAILSFNKDINTWIISPITKKQRAIYKTHSTPNHINTLTENTINIQRTIPKAFMSQRSHNKITIIRPKLLQPTNTGKPKNIPVQHIIFKQK